MYPSSVCQRSYLYVSWWY